MFLTKKMRSFLILLLTAILATPTTTNLLSATESGKMAKLQNPIESQAVSSSAPNSASKIRIDTDFPGGNIKVESIQGDVVRVHQEMRDSTGQWFYWSFRVTGAQGRTIRFEFTTRPPLSTRGPAFSRDGGKTWSWLGPIGQPRNHFIFHFNPTDHQVRFAVGIPYTQENLERFFARFADHFCLKKEILTSSRKNRPIELVRIFNNANAPISNVPKNEQNKKEGKTNQNGEKIKLLLTGTHHACEQDTLYVMEGLLETALSDTETGRWMQNNLDIYAIPFIDKDGVEDGDQGKNRQPHDPNRDYVQEIYPAVKALKKMVTSWKKETSWIMFDFHCPELYDDAPNLHQRIFFTPPNTIAVRTKLQKFCDYVEKHQADRHLNFNAVKAIDGQTSWFDPKTHQKSTGWAEQQQGLIFCGTLEVPYANIEGNEASPENLRQFGHSLAEGLKDFLTNHR